MNFEDTITPEEEWLAIEAEKDWAEYESDMLDDSLELGEGLREVLHEDYEDATPEEIQEALSNILDKMTLAEGFNFNKVLNKIGSAGQSVLQDPTVGQIARPALLVGGAAAGTYFGGPAGTAIGAQLGSAAGQAFTGGQKPAPKTGPAKMPSPVSGTVGMPAKASPKGGSAAAAQLMQLTGNTDMLKALLSLALGSNGKKSVKVGPKGQTVPVGAFVNLLSTLAGKAAADADSLYGEGDQGSEYLLDSEGQFRTGVDPADPESRAETLYEQLHDAENQRVAAEATGLAEDLVWGEAPYGEIDFEEALEDSPYPEYGFSQDW